MCYRERLLPRWWVWLVAFGVVVMLAVAYGAALGPWVGYLVGGSGLALVVWLLWITSPTINIDGTHLAVAGARLPRSRIAEVRELDSAAIDDVLRADARLFTALRPWSCRAGVVVALDDPADPHPAWVISSRRPAALVAALGGDSPVRDPALR